MSNADTGKNPVCANNFKDTTKNVLPIKKTKTKKPSACVFPGINNKMNSFFFQSHHKEEKKSLSSNKTELHQRSGNNMSSCYKKEETCCSYVQPTFLNISQSVTQMLK